MTNCLNFGSPEKPEVMWQFSQAIDGISEACIVLGTPITGGNVSFYNETLRKSIYPTPVIGMLGILEDASMTRPYKDTTWRSSFRLRNMPRRLAGLWLASRRR